MLPRWSYVVVAGHRGGAEQKERQGFKNDAYLGTYTVLEEQESETGWSIDELELWLLLNSIHIKEWQSLFISIFTF
jgi:hypothetical protein